MHFQYFVHLYIELKSTLNAFCPLLKPTFWLKGKKDLAEKSCRKWCVACLCKEFLEEPTITVNLFF